MSLGTKWDPYESFLGQNVPLIAPYLKARTNVANQLANVCGNIQCTLHYKISKTVSFENGMEKESYGFAKCS